MHLKNIDFIIQYECPFQIIEYLNCLKELMTDNPNMKAYLLLLGNELHFLELLKESFENPVFFR